MRVPLCPLRFVCCILLLTICATAQSLRSKTHFEILSSKDGLSNDRVHCIHQDSRGFLWIGTEDGLNRFDGQAFKQFKPERGNEESISNNYIYDIAEVANDNRFWLLIGTENGLNLYDPVRNAFSTYWYSEDDSLSLPHNTVTSATVQDSQEIWLGTNGGGIARMEVEWSNAPATVSFRSFQHQKGYPNSLSNNYVRDVMIEGDSIIWVATSWGLSKLTFDEDSEAVFTNYFHEENDQNSLSQNSLITLLLDRTETLWIGTRNGEVNELKFTNRNEGLFEHHRIDYDPKGIGMVTKVFEDTKQQKWITTFAGTFRLDGGLIPAWDLQDADLSAALAMTACIYEDRTGVFWVGTGADGLIRTSQAHVEQREFSLFVADDSDSQQSFSTGIASIAEDETEGIWLGTAKGIARVQLSEDLDILSLAPPANDVVRRSIGSFSEVEVDVLYQDGNRYLWISSTRSANGLYRIDLQSGEKNHYTYARGIEGVLPSNLVNCVYRDKNSRLWVGTLDGLAEIVPAGDGQLSFERVASTSTTSDLANSFVLTITDAADGIWVGTEGGLSHISGEAGDYQITNWPPTRTSNQGPNNGFIYNIHVDQDGHLWMATGGGGVNIATLADDGTMTFEYLTSEDGLTSDLVYGILADDQDFIWIVSAGGLHRIDPRTNSINTYTESDGLQGRAFSWHGFHRLKDGKLLFGGKNGLNAIDPSRITSNPIQPVVALTDFKLFNRDLSDDDGDILDAAITEASRIQLSHDQNVFSLSYSVLDFQSHENNQSAYMMDGFDDEWIPAASNATVQYTNLDAGTYTFRVRGANNDVVWSKQERAIQIEIAPPPWQTWWAYSIYLLLIAGIWTALRRYDLHRAHIASELKLQKLEAEKFQEIDRLKSRFFANISHEFKTPLTLILGPIQKLLSRDMDPDSKIQLDIAQKNSTQLLMLINEVLDLSRLEGGKMSLRAQLVNVVPLVQEILSVFSQMAAEKHIELKFECEADEIFLFIDTGKFKKVMNNLLSNALKFTPEEGHVTVTATVEADYEVVNGADTQEKKSRSGTEAVVISVADTGVGIPEGHLPHVFDRFYQIDSAPALNKGGSGIGLALTKELVQLHGATINVHSVTGEYTRFEMSFPTGRDHLDDEEIIPSTEEISEKRISVSPQAVPEDSSQDALNAADPDMPIALVVDDQPEIRRFIGFDLHHIYQIIEAADGQQGWSAALEHIPDIIISDVMMPEMDGFELCDAIKKDPRTSHIPVILLTAKSAEENRLQGLRTGADAYVVKPFNVEELRIRVANLIEQRQKIHDSYRRKLVLQPSQPENVSLDDQFLQQALQIIEEQIDNAAFDVESFSTQMAVSRMQLHRKLKALTGQSATEFVRSIRLKRAAQLFENQYGNVTEVALAVGITSLSYFTRSFQKQFGESPGAYAQRFSSRGSRS